MWTPWLLVLCALLGQPGSTPAAERAPRVERLRAQLSSAEQALHEQQWAQAEALFADAVGLAEQLSPSNLLLARAADGLADVKRLQGRADEAIVLYQRAISLWERHLGPQQPRLAVSLHNLGAAYLEQGMQDEARTALERALVIFQSTLGEDSREAGQTRLTLELTDRRR
jgi:centrosomal protein CEP104